MKAAPGAAAVLQVQGLGFAYPGHAPLALNWSVTIAAGVTLVHGDTGTGKSTLLRCLAGELAATGRLELVGTRLDEDRAAYRRNLFLSDPATEAFDQVTARRCTAALGVDDAGFDAAEWQGLVEGFGLTPHLDKPLYMLSTGSRRKVWLAAALASGRALVLLDEPGAALDAASLRCLRAGLARRAQRDDAAVLVASAERLDGVALAGVIELPLR